MFSFKGRIHQLYNYVLDQVDLSIMILLPKAVQRRLGEPQAQVLDLALRQEIFEIGQGANLHLALESSVLVSKHLYHS